MNSRQRIKTIISGGVPDRCGFWLGNPHPDTWPILHEYFGTKSEEELRLKLGDDFRWVAPWNVYKHPEGKPIFEIRKNKFFKLSGSYKNIDLTTKIISKEKTIYFISGNFK